MLFFFLVISQQYTVNQQVNPVFYDTNIKIKEAFNRDGWEILFFPPLTQKCMSNFFTLL